MDRIMRLELDYLSCVWVLADIKNCLSFINNCLSAHKRTQHFWYNNKSVFGLVLFANCDQHSWHSTGRAVDCVDKLIDKNFIGFLIQSQSPVFDVQTPGLIVSAIGSRRYLSPNVST